MVAQSRVSCPAGVFVEYNVVTPPYHQMAFNVMDHCIVVQRQRVAPDALVTFT